MFGEENRIPSPVLERALTVLGPEDCVVRAGLETALQRAKDKAKVTTPSRAPVPGVTLVAARVRVVKLEAALAALADVSGREVDALSQSCSFPPTSGCPIVAMSTTHRTDCQMYRRSGEVSRSGVNPSARGSGSVATSATRGRTCVSASSSGVRCLVRSVAFAEHCVPVAGTVGKVGRGVAGVATDGVIQESIEERTGPPRKLRMPDRRKSSSRLTNASNMRVAVEVGNASEVNKLAATLAEGASQLKSWTLNPSMATNVVRPI